MPFYNKKEEVENNFMGTNIMPQMLSNELHFYSVRGLCIKYIILYYIIIMAIYTVGTESIQTPLNFSLCYIAAIC